MHVNGSTFFPSKNDIIKCAGTQTVSSFATRAEYFKLLCNLILFFAWRLRQFKICPLLLK